MEKEEIFDNLIDALLEEFNSIRGELKAAQYTKHKPQLWNNLFRCADTLRELLLSQPETGGDVADWRKIIEAKVPQKIVKKLLKI